MHFNENQNRPILAIVYSIIFLILLLLVKLQSSIIIGIDHMVQSLIFPLTNERLTTFVSIFTNLGSPVVSLILSLLVIAFIFFKREYAAAIWSFGTLIAGNVLAFGFKFIAARPRPAIVERLAQAHGYSFPSGHVFGTTLFVLLLLTLIVPRIKSQTTQTVIRILAVLWVILIMLSRIYLRVHYPTDTFGSLLLAGAVWEFAVMIWEKFMKSSKI